MYVFLPAVSGFDPMQQINRGIALEPEDGIVSDKSGFSFLLNSLGSEKSATESEHTEGDPDSDTYGLNSVFNSVSSEKPAADSEQSADSSESGNSSEDTLETDALLTNMVAGSVILDGNKGLEADDTGVTEKRAGQQAAVQNAGLSDAQIETLIKIENEVVVAGEEQKDLHSVLGLKIKATLQDITDRTSISHVDGNDSGQEGDTPSSRIKPQCAETGSLRAASLKLNEDVTLDENTLILRAKTNGRDQADSIIDNLISGKKIRERIDADGSALRVLDNIPTSDDVAETDLPENHSNLKIVNSKPITGDIGDLRQEKALKDQVQNSLKIIDTENADQLNNSYVTKEGNRLNTGLSAGNVTRPSSFNDLLDSIIYYAKGNNRLGVTVEHENFGKLNIRLNMNNGTVNVHIHASDKAVREFIENNIQHIVDALSKDGVSVGGFSVALRDQNKSGGTPVFIHKDREKEYTENTEQVNINNTLVNVFA